jgi:hypothetical protein
LVVNDSRYVTPDEIAIPVERNSPGRADLREFLPEIQPNGFFFVARLPRFSH